MRVMWLLVGLLISPILSDETPSKAGDEIQSMLTNFRQQPIAYGQPEQVHISFGESVTDIVVTWSTFNSTGDSVVEYGDVEGKLSFSAKGASTLFVDGGEEKRSQYIHRVTLRNLKPKHKYMYHCGSELGWSPLFFFTTVDPTTNWSPKLLVYGDMGNVNARALPYLQEEVQTQNYAAAIHVGDFAYDMFDDNGRVGDEFMNQITPIAAYIPYMVCPGNHEKAYNFSHYKNRFSMPGPYENFLYSWNLGPIHFISFNTEAYYKKEQFGTSNMKMQYEWLEQDLAEANKPENRAERPWIITYGHRPMYRALTSSRIRTGGLFNHKYGLEKMFYNYGVDLEFWGHEHLYQRLWPIYDYVVYNGSISEPYTNPKAPVHVVSGSAGCQDVVPDPLKRNPKPWSAFLSKDYGYTRLQVFNRTHLYWEQVSVNKGGEVIDSIWLIKENHGKY